ncbi:hypothetical protein K7432_013990 [Basidiobolus ranarum]|uniref:3-dehydroquinate synthase n=1 Tax=Basidiobolus ranarum TaxID=34480 RepID=A0ABR2VQZ0_9FUNG
MSDMKATVQSSTNAFHIEGYEKITYDFKFVHGIFNSENGDLAECYKKWGRCLAVVDHNVSEHYGEQMADYFKHYNLTLKVFSVHIGEQGKTMSTFLSIVDAFAEFGLVRKEPVLVIGGGLVTDVAGFACASYRRNSNFIRIPTTLIGLIDASVAIKVAVNHGKLKNRLGAYHAPMMTFLDFSFLRTLPKAQIRNGMAELIKISVVSNKEVFDLLDKYGDELLETHFGHVNGTEEVRAAADKINYDGIKTMLELEVPNLHEIELDRVIAFGHTWSPTLELTPKVPLRHGHAINIDMAYSVTIAQKRGYITEEERDRIHKLMSRIGLSLHHELFEIELISKATESIKLTRDGLLRAAVPKPIGLCHFINNLSREEMEVALFDHRKLVKKYPRGGDGVDAYVDAIDMESGEDLHHLLKQKTPKSGPILKVLYQSSSDKERSNGSDQVSVDTATDCC